MDRLRLAAQPRSITMLKRLELVGFKSFADKTVFEFPAGVTAIVGPNGSGKSNVVDAVRWVLGEQSAKSLRGGAMTDVIFNGSTARKSLGLAEVTMAFDNSRGALATEAAEVQITRRVYRDGEGEYLINGLASRLKDIKDLFLGSGAGAGAYCIIEQGRVDALLQASTVDRRTIFEEAAGISRFKAKKAEALRRLERVEQNLTRLRDILAEVENQLRSVRLQAAKAQRYQEYTGRLRDLRLALGLREYRQLGEQLAGVETVLARLRCELAAAAARSADWAADTQRLERELADLEAAAKADEEAVARARTEIAAHEATLAHERRQAGGLEADVADTGRRLDEADARMVALIEARSAAEAEWQEVEAQCDAQQRRVDAVGDRLRELVSALADLNRQIETDKSDHLERMRLAARLQNDAVSAGAHLDQLRRERERLCARNAQAAENLATLDLELETLISADTNLQNRLMTARFALADRTADRDRTGEAIDGNRVRLADLKAHDRGLASRIEVLENLERSREGYGAGIREVLDLITLQAMAPQPSGLAECVIGLVGDLLTAPREVAHLLDIALGQTAQSVLVRDQGRLVLALEGRDQTFAGRVSFVPLWPIATADMADEPLARRADRLVSCDHPDLASFPAQTLGTTWIVPDLTTAREYAARWPGQRFVTLAGELLDADGTITVGAHQRETGILSRKSELRDLRAEAARLAEQIAGAERELGDLTERAEELDGQVRTLTEEIGVLAEQAVDLRERVGRHRQRWAGLHEEVTLSRTELSGLDEEIARVDASWRQAQTRAEAAEHEAQGLQVRLEQAERTVRAQEHERVQVQQACTEAHVSLAQAEQRLAGLRERHEQFAGDLLQRHQERDGLTRRRDSALTRLADGERTQLIASAALAECCHVREQAERRLADIGTRRDAARAEERRLHAQMQSAHSAWQARQEQIHAQELQAGDYRHRSDALVQRLGEDYQIDLIAESAKDDADGAQLLAHGGPDEAQAEIDDLRRKLSRLGAVNLDSLQELAELEQRDCALRAQFGDLTAAQNSLRDIIDRINRDSRQLFTETFALIRTNFQHLFRKLFGGGQADVVLEDEADVLESGIEVMARPPGKELRSISLMSGGEKTLTAVALLLAIFRSKPSPFCLLDEVDAALDEANTARLTGVLREFLDRSQFIIITHAKRTMAAADVLYGVTMQESGVSKRVAVRFEDWPDDRPQKLAA
jgi:chromosome segregation protein